MSKVLDLTANEQRLLALLRSGLWSMPVPDGARELWGDAMWPDVRSLALAQSVLGVVADGLERLPEELQPATSERVQWLSSQVLLEKHNARLLAVLDQLVAGWKRHDWEFVLLKGAAAGRRYARPEHRMPGDIDMLVSGAFEPACQWMLEHGAKMEEEAPEVHQGFAWQGVEVEVHHSPSPLCRPASLQFLKEVGMERRSRLVPLGESLVPVLDAEVDVVYMLVHMTHHLIGEGLGLRQVCDWMLAVKEWAGTWAEAPASEQEAAWERLHVLLQGVRMVRPMAVMLALGRDLLGLDAALGADLWERVGGASPPKWLQKELQGAATRQAERAVCRLVMHGGNFGRMGGDKHYDHHTLWGNVRNAKTYVKRTFQLYDFCPDEAHWHLVVRTRRWLGKLRNAF